MTDAPSLRFVVPAGVDDPRRVSGGNVYDRHIRDGLRRRGWEVDVREAADAGGAASVLRDAPDRSRVLVDGLVAGWAPAAVEEAAGRLRLTVLAHMVTAAFPDATDAAIDAERRALASAHGVIVTSTWTAAELARRELADPVRTVVAVPGTLAAEPAAPPADAGQLLCIGVIAPHKGQDTLLTALTRLRSEDWSCTIVGSTDAFPEFAAVIARQAAALDGRVRLVGVLDDQALDDAYRRCALLIAPSRVESSGMAIADARARGIPVLGAETGGIPDALAAGGGLLVQPGDPAALAAALDSWLTDPALRGRLRREALAARATLPTWRDTVARVADALEAA
ncbi:glycosyltransferase family 4 protein [Microbacterium trichothecenolyticum]|uniref:glycosyltransferase family 4 protein n=1 Tax=Microbacterium trichothecenolyticum TaxID=69370 RepID=UPI0035BE2B5A